MVIRRFLAYVIDFSIIFFITSFFLWQATKLFHFPSYAILIIFLLVFIHSVYGTLLTFFYGKTIGKKILGIKVISNSDTKINFLQASTRESLFRFLSTILNIGYLLAIINPQGITLHDRLARTRVVYDFPVSKHPVYGRTVLRFVLFFFFIFLSLLIQTNLIMLTFNYIKDNHEINPQLACSFPSDQIPAVESNHFNIYIEKGGTDPDIKFLRTIFEQAFDYSFWELSSLDTVSTRTTVCLYRKVGSFRKAVNAVSSPDWTYAFFFPYDKTIHFSDKYLGTDQKTQKEVAYHEVNHYVLANLLNSNNYQYPFPSWFKEGLAQIVESYYNPYFSTELNSMKATISKKSKQWIFMDTYKAINGNFTENNFYDESYLILKFLEEKFGNDISKKIIAEAVNSRITFNSALEKTTSSSLSKLEDDWQKWLLE